MDLSRLESIRLLGGANFAATTLGNLDNLAREHHVAGDTDDWGEFPSKVRKQGRAAAREVLELFDNLPDLAGAHSHLHFATGTEDPNMAPAGSQAAEAMVKWADLRSRAVALVSYDFNSLPLHPPDDAQAIFDQIAGLLDNDADRFIAARLRFFGARPA